MEQQKENHLFAKDEVSDLLRADKTCEGMMGYAQVLFRQTVFIVGVGNNLDLGL
jgi:hypothetical protein